MSSANLTKLTSQDSVKIDALKSQFQIYIYVKVAKFFRMLYFYDMHSAQVSNSRFISQSFAIITYSE